MEESTGAKIARLSQIVKSANEKQALKDIEVFKRQQNRARQTPDHISKDRTMRKVAEIPLSLFVQLPKEVQNDQKALADWLQTYGKDFMEVDSL